VREWAAPIPEHVALDSDYCNIPILDATDWKNYKLDWPVILVNLTNNSVFADITRRANLLGP
jgi:hypothetical protein